MQEDLCTACLLYTQILRSLIKLHADIADCHAMTQHSFDTRRHYATRRDTTRHDAVRGGPWTVCVPLLRVKGSITALLSLRTVLFNYLIIYWNCYKTAGIQLNWIKFWKSMHCFFYSWVNCIKKLKKIYSYWFYIFNGGLLKYSAYIQTWHMRSRSCTLVVLVK